MQSASTSYSEAPQPVAWRRRIGRMLFWWPLGAIGLLCVIYCDPIKDRAELLYWQRQCLNHRNLGNPVSVFATPPPACWITFNAMNGTSIGPTGGVGSACVFLGRLRRPDGVERLVDMEVTLGGIIDDRSVWIRPSIDRLAMMQWVIMKPAGVIDDAVALLAKKKTRLGAYSTISLPYDAKLNKYGLNGAVVDPANPSHLTIRLGFSDGSSHPVDAYLDNNDRITIHQVEIP